mmetsp:Transcript_17930/g.32454  ORF Transcript_17930/g.32454 Transcript_17930/m.32454 type:complete len:503 (-) Transcript_17930:149-1657(-)
MFHGVLDKLLEVTLDILQTTNIIPTNIRHLHNRLPQTTRIAHAQRMPEMILIHSHTIQNLRINLLFLNINQIHLLANTLHRRLSTKCRNISTHESVRLPRNRLGIDILIELHVTGVDAEYLQTAVFVGDSNVDLAIESSEASEGGIHGVGTVGRADDHDRRTLLEPVHEGEHLRNNTPFHFPIGLVTFGSDGINLINEDDGGSILLRLLERLAKVGLTLSRHFGHDFGSIDEEEECPRLVRDRTGNEGLSTSRRTIQQHPTGGLHAQRLEERGVAEGQLDHLANLGHLLATSPHVVISHVVGLLLVLALHGFALAVDDGVGRDNTVWSRVGFHHLELDGMHRRPNQKEIALFDGTVSLQKVRLEVHVKEVPGHALDGVIQREDVDTFPVRDIPAIRHGDDVRESDAQILTYDLVHSHTGIVARFVGQNDAYRVLPLFSLDEDGITAEEGELLHLGWGEGDDGVVVVRGIVHHEAVRGALFAEDGIFHVGVFVLGFYHFGKGW